MSRQPKGEKPLSEALREARAMVASAAVRAGATDRVGAALAELDRAIDAAPVESTHHERAVASRAESAPAADVRSRNHFLAVVCHDLKDPLAAVMMGAAFLLKTTPPNPENPRARRMTEAILRSGERMNALVKNLVDFLRIEGGHIDLEKRACDAATLLDAAAEKLRPAADEKQVSIVREARAGIPVMCDVERFGVILLQLAGNAIRYSPRSSEVVFRAEPTGTNVRFTITDHGPGISGDRLANIFDPYWHARQSPRDGTGLGIAIAKGLIEAQGGHLEIRTRKEAEGAGTTVTFTLPQA